MRITHPRLTGDALWHASTLWLKGQSTTEIAAALGVSEATVANSLPTLREPETTIPAGEAPGGDQEQSIGDTQTIGDTQNND